MAEGVDVLFINPGDRKQIYQDLGTDYAAIYDTPALGASAVEAARVTTEEYAVVNGDRNALHDLYGINVSHIVDAALELAGKQ